MLQPTSVQGNALVNALVNGVTQLHPWLIYPTPEVQFTTVNHDSAILK